jgi:hypothetical protein
MAELQAQIVALTKERDEERDSFESKLQTMVAEVQKVQLFGECEGLFIIR